MPWNTAYSISADSELLHHFSPDVIHQPSHTIQGVYDENARPLVFSTTKETLPRLALTISDPVTGKNQTFDLSKVFGITKPVTNIAAFQDDSQNIYFAFTVEMDSSSGDTNLYVVAASQANVWRDLVNLPKLLLRPERTTVMSFQDLFFVPGANAGAFFHGSNYPLLIVQTETSLQRVKVDPQTSLWSLIDGELPIPADEAFVLGRAIMSVSPFEIQTWTHLKLRSFQSWYHVYRYNTTTKEKISSFSWVGPGVTSKLVVITNQTPDKTNDLLLIQSDGLLHHSAAHLSKGEYSQFSRVPGIDDTFFLENVQDAAISQSGSEVAIWLRTIPASINENTISSTILSTKPDGGTFISRQTTPIYSGDISGMCPIFDTASQSHHFLILTESGDHVLLQFKQGNSVWEELSWLISDLGTDNEEVLAMTSTVSYHTHIIVRDPQGYPASNLQLLMTASDTVGVTINGYLFTLAQKAVSVTTDVRGCLSVLSPVDSLGSSSVYQLYLGTAIGGPIDPAVNIRNRLSEIQSGDNLREAKLQSDGSPLLKDSDVPDSTINEAGTNLGKLYSQLQSLPVDGSSNSVTALGLFSKAWATWHYVEHKATAAVQEFKVVEHKVVAMVIKIGNEALEFVIDTAARAFKAMNYVLKQIKLELDRIVDWIGFLFSWEDIMKTQSDIVKTTTAYFTQVSKWAPTLVPIIDKGLDAGLDMVDSLLDEMISGNLKTNGTLGGFYESIQQASQQQTSTPEKVLPQQSHAGTSSASTSPGAQWTNNHMFSGSIVPLPKNATNSRFLLRQESKLHVAVDVDFVSVVADSGLAQYEARFQRPHHRVFLKIDDVSAKGEQSIEDLGKLLEPILGKIESAFETFAKSLESVVLSGLENIGANLIRVITTFLKEILKIIKDAIEAFLNAAEEIIETLVSYILQETIDIPFISALWHHFTGHDPPSVLEIFCILLAIPTTVIAKIAAPKDTPFWPDLSAWTGGSAYASFDVGSIDSTSAFNQIKAYVTGSPGSNPAALDATQSEPLTGPSAEDWENWAKATICAHPTATLVEAAMQFCNRYYFKRGNAEIATENIEKICLLSELVALAFSFPNLKDFSQDSWTLRTSSILEIIAFATRSLDALLTVVFTYLMSKKSNDEDTKAKWEKSKDNVFKACTGVEFVLNLAATVVRMIGLANKSSENEVEMIADGIAMANVFSSVVSQYAIFNTGKEKSPSWALAAGVLTLADFGLDLGRGIYEWVEIKKQLAGDDDDDALAGDYSGSHRVVTF